MHGYEQSGQLGELSKKTAYFILIIEPKSMNLIKEKNDDSNNP